MLRANTQRVLDDLHHLRSIGAYKTGVYRLTLSADDINARKWLADQLHAIGHKAKIEGIANVHGRAPSGGPVGCTGRQHIESKTMRAGSMVHSALFTR